MKAPVSACFVVREDAHIVKAVESIAPFVEEVIVVDTGSRHETQVPGAKFVRFTDCNDSQGRIADFSVARNFSFSLAKQPHIIWADADDIITGGEFIAEAIRNAEKSSAGKNFRIFAPYEYVYDYDNECTLLQGRERIVNRRAWKWTRSVHEGLVPVDATEPHVDIVDHRIVWKHRRQSSATEEINTRDAGRNLRILQAMAARGEDDARLHLDIGFELASAAQVTSGNEVRRAEIHANAKKHLKLALDRSPSDVDAFGAHLELGEIAFREAGIRTYFDKQVFDPKEAEEHLFEALRLKDHWDVPHFRIARLAYASASSGMLTDSQRKKYEERVIRFAKSGLAVQTPPIPFAHNPFDRKVAVHEWLSDCLARNGDFEGALESVETALRSKPLIKHLRAAKREYEGTIARRRVMSDIGKLHSFGVVDDALQEIVLSAIDDPRGLKDRLVAMSRGGKQEGHRPTISELESTLSGKGPMDIVFACGTTIEPWNPDIYAKQGLGGSETAVIEMSKRLAARGHNVRVYCTCGEEMVRDGVQYLRAGKLFAAPACDILVAWRMSHLLESENGPISVRAKALWVHDVDPAGMNIARGFLADKVFGLSKWHCDHLAKEYRLHSSQIVRTRNGLNLDRFDVEGIQRNPRRAVWSSSFDRGLVNLLNYWPDIRKRVPDAELHIFYGNIAHKKAATHLKDAVMAKWIAETEEKIESLADQGVVMRGRVEQKELAKEFLAAGCWLYSTGFTETHCVTACEAQAAGLSIVATDLAALHETVINGTLIPGTPEDGESYRKAFIAAAVCAFETEQTTREEIQKTARESFSWDPVADQWEEVFREMLTSAENQEILPYVPQAAE